MAEDDNEIITITLTVGQARDVSVLAHLIEDRAEVEPSLDAFDAQIPAEHIVRPARRAQARYWPSMEPVGESYELEPIDEVVPWREAVDRFHGGEPVRSYD